MSEYKSPSEESFTVNSWSGVMSIMIADYSTIVGLNYERLPLLYVLSRDTININPQSKPNINTYYTKELVHDILRGHTNHVCPLLNLIPGH